MDAYRIAGLTTLGMIALIEPAFATVAVPGPIAGVGLPAVVIVGAAFWFGRRLFKK
jgi:hypothetical protein